MVRAAFRRQAGLKIGKARDGPAVGIDAGVVKGALKRAHDFLTQHVLNVLGVIVHVVRRNLGLVGEVQLPEAVIANNLTGALPALGRKMHLIAILMQCGEIMPRQFGRKAAGIFFRLIPAFSQLAQGNALALKVARLEHVV